MSQRAKSNLFRATSSRSRRQPTKVARRRRHHVGSAALTKRDDLVGVLYEALQQRVAGVATARKALRMSRVGAESRMETLLRLKLDEVGVRDVALQVELSDEYGFIGRFDLVDAATRRIFEYDGEQHRTDRAQYLKDHNRLERARLAGWQVLRFHHEDLFVSPAAFARRLERRLGLAGSAPIVAGGVRK